MCETHLRDMVLRSYERRKARVAQGLCIYCGKLPAEGTQLCLGCRSTFYGARSPKTLPRALIKQQRAIERRQVEEKQLAQRKIALDSLLSEDWDDLSERQTYMIQEYYGLKSGVPRPLDSLGKEYGITRERVRQLIKPFKEVAKVLGLNRKKTERVVE